LEGSRENKQPRRELEEEEEEDIGIEKTT